jgi:hypothetical protein
MKVKKDAIKQHAWNKCKFRYRSSKLVIKGGKCNLIVQVAKMVLDLKG